MRLISDISASVTSSDEMPREGWPAVLPYLAAIMAATWPIWRWYVARMSDGSDEPWGILALITWAGLVWLGASKPAVRLGWPAALLALYGLTYPFIPALGRAGLALGAIGALLFRGRGKSSLWGLAALSLPVVATLQFYAGYPLRALAASASVWLLRAAGFGVVREGSVLHWRGEIVMVDVPCSGVHMLWCGLYLACVLAAFHQLSLWRTVVCGASALGLVVAANATRAAVLFFKEAQIVEWPSWTHAGVGVALFAAAAVVLAAIANRLAFSQAQRRAEARAGLAPQPCAAPAAQTTDAPPPLTSRPAVLAATAGPLHRSLRPRAAAQTA